MSRTLIERIERLERKVFGASEYVPPTKYQCPSCDRLFTSPQGLGLHFKHGCKAAGFRPPTYREVRAYCDERKNEVDPVKFVDFYTSKGWLVGKVKMKDWQAAVRNWEKSKL